MSHPVIDTGILTSGMLIKTKFSESKGWVTNIVESVSGSTIRIPLINEYFTENILVDNSINIEFENSLNQYIVKGYVVNIDIVGTQTMSVKIKDINQFKNRRKSIRYYTSYGTNITSDNVRNLTGIVTNVSSTGICFVTNHPFDMSTSINLDVLLSFDNILRFSGKIVRIKLLNYGFEYAIEINSAIHAQNIKTLISIIENQTNNLREALYKKFNIILKRTSKSFFNLKILIVDNSNLLRHILKNELRNIGISNIVEASNSIEAIKSVEKEKPDIICLSYLTYVSEDNSIFEKLLTANPDAKVLLVSATSEDKIDKHILKKYAIEFIPKSLGYNELLNTIKKY